MATSTSSEFENIFKKKANRVFSLLLLSFLSVFSAFAQPAWVATTPSIPSTGPLTISVNYGINVAGTVYITVVNFDYSPIPTSAQIKAGALAGPAGGRVATAFLTVTAGNANALLNTVINVINANTTHSVFIVAENGAGVLQAVPIKLLCATQPCPKLQLFTFFGNVGECVNVGASGMFQAAPLGFLPTGVLKGTTWTIDWGDGSAIWSYTSSADNDIPPMQLHPFATTTNCAYIGRWTVKNPCNEFLSSSSVFVVHGRDIPADGDGLLRMEEVSTHTPDIIYLCEGKQYNITLADISRWNCQSPNVPSPLNPADYDNDKPRTIQFVYGETPAGAVMNTITGNVLIGGTNIANGLDGYVGPVITPINPPNPNTQSSVITIPVTATLGQRFYVYIKNWNKCNPYTGNPNAGYEFEDFIIEIIDSPPAPTVVTPQSFCVGSVPLTISATPTLPGNTLNWYADAALTMPLATGLALTHGKTAVGTTPFWVTETSGVNGCEGPAARIDLVINPLPNKPTISNTGSLQFCYDGGLTTITLTANIATPPNLSSYQWYKDGVAVAGAITPTIVLGALSTQTGSYTVRAFGISPSNCPGPLSDPVSVIIHSLSNLTNPIPVVVCENGTAVFTATTTDLVQNYQWEESSNGGSSYSTVGNGPPNSGGFSNTLTISPVPYSLNGHLFRLEIKTPPGQGGCPFKSLPALLTVNQIPTANAGSALTSICQNGTSAALGGSIGGGAAGGTWSSPAGGTFSPAATNLNATWTPPVGYNGTATLTLTTSGGSCGTATASKTQVVNPPSAGGSISGGTTPLCQGSATGTMTLSGHTGSVIQWEKNVNAGGWSVIANTATTYSETPSGAGTWQYRALVKSGACASTYSGIRTIVVNPTTDPGTLSGGNTPICLGSSVGTLTLSAYTGSIIRWEYQLNSGGWNTIVNTNPTFSGTPGVSGTFDYRVVVRSSPCALAYSNVITIVVNPLSVGGSISGGSTPICIGSGTGTMTLSVYTGSITRWEKQVNSGGWSVIANTTTTYSEVPSSAGSWEYRALVTSGACTGAYSSIRTIVVNPLSVGGTLSGGSTPICLGSNTGTMTVAGYTGSITRWEKRVNSGGWSNITNTNTTYSEVPSSAGTWDYRVLITSGACAGAYSTIVTIVVDPTSNGGSISGGSTPICLGSNTGVMTLSGHTGSILQWEKRVNGGGWSIIANTAATYSEVPSSSGTWDYRALVQSGTCASVYSSNSTIVVDPTSVGGTITGGSTPICYNVSTGTMTLSGHTGSVVQWEKQLNGGGWAVISNTATTYSEVPTASGTWDYRALVKSGACASIYSGLRTIVVRPQFSLAQLHDDASICNNTATNINVAMTGGTSPFTVNYTKNGAPQGAWNAYVSGTSMNTGALLVNTTYALTSVTDNFGCPAQSLGTSILITVGSAPTAATLTGSGDGCFGTSSTIKSVITGGAPTYTINYTRNGVAQGPELLYNSGTNINLGILPVGTYNYQITSVTDLCGHTVPLLGLPPVYTITINAIPNAVTTVNNNPAICNNGSTDIVLHSDLANSDFIYTVANVPAVTWQAGKSPAGGTILNGEGTSIAQNLAHNGTVATTVTYTITPRGPGGTACLGSAITRNVIVYPTPNVTTASALTICNGGTTSIALASNVAGATFSWIIGTITGGITGASASSGATISQTLANGGTTAGTVTYIVTPSANGCPGSATNFVVTVNPTPNVTTASSLTVCNGSSTNIALASNVTGATFSWTIGAITGGITGASASSGATISQVLTNGGTTAGTVTYRVSPSANGCPGAATNFVVTVNPTPNVTTASSLTVCNGSSTNIALASNVTGATFSWTIGAITGGITGASASSGATISQVLTNGGTTAGTVTYRVTPSANGCPGAATNFVVTVNPTPNVTTASSLTICNGGTTSIALASNVAGATFSWTIGTITGGITGATASSGATISQTLANGGTTSGTVTYIVTPSANGCPGTATNFVVTVNPTPNVTTASSLTICNGGTTSIALASNVAGATFSWTIGTITGGITGASASSGPTISQTLANGGTTAGTVTYIVTPSANGCPGAATNFVVTVNPTPNVTTASSLTICNGGTTSIALASNVAGATFSWTIGAITGGITGASASSGATISQVLTNGGTTAGTVTYRVTPSANGCPGAATNFVVTVNPTPNVTTASSLTICNGGTTSIALASNVAGATFSWIIGTITGGITGASASSGATISQTLANGGTTAGTVTYIVTPSANGCPGSATNFVVTVNPTPNVTTASSLTVCNGSSTNIALASNVTGATFSWTIGAITGGITGASASSGATISQVLTNGGTTAGTVTYRVTPSANGCPGAATNFVVTVNPTPNVTTASSLTICNGGTTSIALASNVAGATFSWTIGTITGGITGATASSGATIAQALTNAGTAAGTVTYIVTPTANGCPGNATNFMVTVNPTPNVTTASSLTICNGATTNIALASNVAGTTFNWTIGAITGGITGATASSGATIAQALANGGTTTGTVTYIVTPTANGCPGSATNFVVTVNPTPNVTTASSLTICNGGTTSIALASNVAGATFSWTIGAITGGITGATASSGATIAQALANAGNTPGTVTYRVTPTANGCPGSVTNFVVTVNPTPAVGTVSPLTICNGSTTNIVLTSNVGGTTFSWTIGAITGGITGASAASGGTITQTLTNGGSTFGTVTYIVTPTANSCPGSATNFVVQVNPTPTASISGTVTACQNDPGPSVVFTNPQNLPVTITYNINGGLPSTINVNASNTASIIAPTVAQGIFNYNLVSVAYQSAPACSNAITGTATVTVTQTVGTPVFILGATSSRCQGAGSVTYTANAVSTTGISYTLDGPSMLGGNIINATTGEVTYAATWSGISTITASAAGCGGPKTASHTVTTVATPATPVIGGGGKTSMCKGTLGQFYSVPLNAGNRYTWSVAPATTVALGGNPGDNFIVLNFPNPGIYTLSVQEFTPAPLNCPGPLQTLTITVYDNPVVDPGAARTICAGEPTTLGAVLPSVTASGGSGTFTYLWTPSFGLDDATSPNPVATTNATRTYTLNVTDVISGCATVIRSVVVTVNPAPTAYNVTGPNYYCFGTPGITLNLSGSQPGVNYQLYLNGVSAGPLQLKPGTGVGLNWTNLTTGTYIVKATNAVTLCTNDMNGSITVAENPDVVINNITPIEPSCFSSNDGVISINASGGTGALQYSINNGVTFQSSGTFSSLIGGTYNIIVKDTRSCSKTAIQILNQPTALSITSLTVTGNITCFGGSNGSARVVVAGGTPAYIYEWYSGPGLTNPIGQVTDQATNLVAGTYWVKITDFNGCWISSNITITQPAIIAATASVTSNYNGSQLSCNGSTDGRIAVTAAGGTGTLSYLLVEQPLNVTGAATGIFTGLGAGSYSVKVTDINLCNVTTLPVTITAPSAVTATTAITSNYNGSHLSCATSTDGRITVTASGGTGSLSYLLNEQPGNVTGSISGIFTGLGAGSYTIRVRDLNLCTVNTVAVTIIAPSAVTATAAVTSNYNGSQVSCNGASDGRITVTASGGTGALGYQLIQMPGNVTGASSGIFTGVPAGSYTVRVTDLNGCNVTTLPVTITNPTAIAAPISITSNYNGARISCFGASDGRIAVAGTGGTGALTYVLDQDPANVTGVTTGIFTGLPAGTYTVTVTDANSCSRTTTSVTLNNPAAVTAIAAVTSNYNGSQVSCNGASDGRITVMASGGTGALSYLLVEMPANVTGAASGVFTGVPANTYTVRVSDLNGCNVITVPVTISNPLPVTATALVTSNYNGRDVSCFGASDGRITVTASGGSGALTYVLNEIPLNLTGLNTGIFSGVPAAASYTVKVTDKNGCNVNTLPIAVTNPPAVTATALVTSNYNGSQVRCNGSSDGEITVTAGGGTGALNYTIIQLPGNLSGVASGVFTGIAAGTYTIKVTDVNGCNVTTASVVISNPAAVTATGSVTSNYNGRHVSCDGASDGIITIISGGGTGVRTYVLDQNPANVTGAATGIFTGLNAGNYTVTVTDANGCSKTTSNITVINPPVITATAAVTSNYNGSQLSCNGSTDGRIAVTAAGGTGTLSYLLVEQPLNVTGAATGIFTGLGAGSYSVRVTDINGCNVTTAPVIITAPSAVTAVAAITSNYNGSHLSCATSTDGRITVTASGGTGSLSYLLNEQPGNVTGSISGIFTGLGAGTYTVRVRDLNLCTVNTAAVTIIAPAAVTASAAVTSNYNGSQVSCNGSSDGRITVTAAGGTGALGYQLIQMPGNVTGASSGIFTGVPAGAYTVRVTDLNGCNVTTVPVTITNPTAIAAPISITSNYNGARISCFGASDGRIAVAGTGGTGALTYVLDQDPANVTGVTTGIFTGLPAGTYTVTVTDANSCSRTTTSVTLNNPAAVTAIAAVTSNYNGSQVSCNGASDGRITVMASGGTGALSYLLVEMPANVTGAASGVFTGVPANTYTVRVSDLNGCNVITVPVTISNPLPVTATALVTSNYNGRDVSCFGASDGRITVTASGGSGALTYVLNEIPLNLTGLNTGIFSGVPAAASYTVKVTDKNGCNVNTLPIAVTNPPAVTATALITSNYNGSQVRCNGSSDGEITVTAGGGTGALNYTIIQLPGNLSGVASGVFTGIAAGTYTIKVTDVNGCNVTTLPVTIVNPAVITATGSVTSNYNGRHVSCDGASDGIITIISGGGTGVRTYVLDQNPANVTGAATGVFTGLNAGNYTVTVTDANGCTKTTSNITVINPPVITATASVTSNYNGSQLSCNGSTDGRIAVTAAGGTGTLSYLLVEQPLNVTGAATGIFTGLGAGSYSVRVTDINGCNVTTAPVIITAPSAVTAVAAITSNYNGSHLSCATSTDGRITVTASGGTGSLSYLLNEQPGNVTGSISGIFTGLGAGTYTVRVRDLNLCTVNTAAVTIIAPAAVTASAAVTSNYNGSQVSCNGSSDGRITVTAAGGTGALGYQLIQMPGNVTGASSGIFTGVPAGAYTVRVTDLNGCNVTTVPVTITNPTAIAAPISITSNYNGARISCFGASDGRIAVAGTGGTGALTYVLDQDPANVTGVTTGIFTGLPAGTYTVTVTDANSCSRTTTSVTLNNPAAVTAIAAVTSNYNGSQVSCNGASDGRITVMASGGTGALSYLLVEMPANVTGAASGVFTGVPANTYTVRVSDLNGCNVITVPVTISNPLPVTATALVTSNYNGRDVSCFGASDGRITVTASGGSGALTYVLNEIPLNLTGLNTGIFSGVPAAASYTVKVTDKNGCNVNTLPIAVTNPPAVTATALITSNYNGSQVRCNGSSDGEITVTAGGGTGALNYTIIQLPGNLSGVASGVFTGIAAGTYTIKVTDVNGCNVTTLPVTIVNPAVITATGSVTSNYNGRHVSCDGASDGIITIISGGGTGVRTYVLDQNPANVTGAATGIFTGLNAGNYTVTVTDANGCTKTTSNITVINPPVITATAAVTSNYNGSQLSCNGSTDGRIAVTASGGTGTLSYLLVEQPLNVTGAATGIFTGLGAGSYTVRVTDINLCNVTTLPVTITSPSAVTATTAITSNYNGSHLSCATSTDGRITVTASGGTGALSYLLNEQPGNVTGLISGIFTGLGAGSYTIRVRDLNLCTVNTVAVTIIAPAPLGIAVNKTSNYNGRDISCFGLNDGRAEAVVTGGTGPYSYNWYSDAAMTISIGQLTATALNLSAGTYYVRVRDANSCSTSGNVTLSQPVALNAAITAQTNIVCYGTNNGSVTVDASPGTGTAPYQYSINGGATWVGSSTFNGLSASNYIVTVKDVNGCLKQVPVTITQLPQLAATVTKTDVSCSGANDGTITITSPSGGSGTYLYSGDGGTTWQGSGNFINLVPAMYNVWISDAGNPTCSVVVSPNIIITEPVKLGLSTTGDITLGCFGNTNGTGTFYASGGTLPYSFTVTLNNTGATIAAPGFNSQSFYNAGAGSVTVLVTDFKGCTASETIIVSQPALLTPGTIAASQVLCAGSNPALITESTPASGGPGIMNYQWQYGSAAGGPFINIAGATGAQYTPPAGANSTLYYRRMITSGFCTPVYSNVIEVLVYPRPVAVLTGGETICPAQSSILKVNIMVGTGPFDLDIDNYGTVTGYVSGADITVTPAATTIYRLLRVRDANGCEVLSPSANLLGSATVTVRALPAIVTSPVNKTSCEYGMVTFNVAATGSDLTYQWYVNTGSGFNAVADGGIYFGATNSTLSLFGVTRLMNNYVYHAVVSGCSASVTSADATLTVNTAPEISLQPRDTTACLGAGAAFRITATGSAVTYQWQVNKGAGFINVVDDANFSGSNLSTLTITNTQAAFNNYIFRVLITGTCGIPLYSNFAILRVNIPPTVTLNPVNKATCDGTGPIVFSGNGSGAIDSLRWQVFSAGVWSDVHDNAIYSGATSQQLTVVSVPLALNGNLYRLALKAKCIVVNTTGATLTVNPNPVVDFSAVDPINACGGVPLVINGNPTGGSGVWSTHMWTGDVGPLNNYYVQSPTFSAPLAGVYTLNYRVKDNKGCFGNDDLTVVVDAPDATFTQDRSNGCTPTTVTFSKDMTGIAKFWWDFGDGSPKDSVSTDPVHTFSNTNPSSIEYFNVKLTVRSAGGCSNSYTSSVTVYPAINATFTPAPAVVCSGNQIVFTTLPGASKYWWDFGDGATGYFTNSTNHLYTNFTTAPVVYTVTLTTTSFYNCSDVKTQTVTVMPVPQPQFTASPVSQIYNAAGNPVTFTNTTNPGTWAYLWRFGDGTTSTDQNPSHTYTSLGTFTVVLSVSNANCSDSVKHNVNVTPIPPVANFDLIPSGCSPWEITPNNTSLNTNTPGTTYMWDFGDGGASTSKNPTYVYDTPGTYRVDLTVKGPGGVSNYSQVVNAYPSPKASFQLSPEIVFANDEKVRMYNLSQGADSYLWEFGDGDTSKLEQPFHRYMEEGTYDVTLWAYLHNVIDGVTITCSDKLVLSPGVTVEPAGVIRFSTVFTPNIGAEIDMDHLPTGGTEVDMFFYPPIREKVTDYKLQVFNRWGVLIFESHDINKPWNGYYQHKLCPQGVYVWYVEGKYANGKPFKKVGDVTLLNR